MGHCTNKELLPLVLLLQGIHMGLHRHGHAVKILRQHPHLILGGNLNTLANQMITNIITGAQPVDYFDEFVNLWKSSGGDAITAEINEWYQNR